MRKRVHLFTVPAILAIALHGFLLGLVPPAGAANADPFRVICHAALQASNGDQTPISHVAPVGCEHCSLCSVAAPPALTDTALGRLEPAILLHLLQPDSSTGAIGLALIIEFARGPPAFV
ncbi:MAG TPA: hypothetical protein VFA57_05480 [Pseudolabrys sp.]|nr:hypothetical protein [Pseudolabrys sp.]